MRIKEVTMLHEIDTVIIGGGQAGLAISYHLSQEDREHVVLERAPAVAHAWRNQRWDSFTLVTPNFQVRMPGAEYEGSDPYRFMSLAQVIEYFDDYVKRFRLPVHCGVEVFSVDQMGPSYLVRTSEGNYMAENVVIVTGLYQSPKIPSYSEEIPRAILQMHSMHYRNPADRGKDINDWFTQMGMFDTRVEELQSPKDKFHAHPQISGKDGGQSLNLHKFARDGVILLGHVRDARDGHLILAPDLKETLAKVDQFEIDALKKIDDYIARMGLNVPVESVPKLHDGYGQELLTDLDLHSLGITTIIWATGYNFD